MNITNAHYTASGSIIATIDGQEMTIPADPANRHYAELIEAGVEISPWVEPPLTQEQLNQQIDGERSRRIEAGRTFPVPGLEIEIPLQGRIQDQTAYLALLGRAQAMQGVDGATLTIRDGQDQIHHLTPEQMIALIAQGMGWFEQVMATSWAMKDLTGQFEGGLPDDWRDDQYWPE